ncbi:hypothetical protein QE450_000860 [Paenibacillus sp. SORGH_AS306]|uniref:hypothetical protein n=1 Tax=unclassified Paenibacillus TaxID=185978 RepID=UPI00278225D2|nr:MULTISPECIES: hypothetical protein [unclassified Paenibacillus]MDQ1233362.1 hypothetical protein [Paenibacillus sp. SORGH_AS_0306]MDR6110403.1 hypothetical protein [Paenibacillus sp. SORGH_AS_0338]
MIKFQKKREQRNIEADQTMDYILNYFDKELYKFSNKSLKIKFIRIFIFILVTLIGPGQIFLENTFFYNFPNSPLTLLVIFSTLSMILGLATFARYFLEFVICFILIYAVAFLRIDMTGNIDMYSLIYIIGSGIFIYLIVQVLDYVFRNSLYLASKKEGKDEKELRVKYHKGYEQLYSEFDHASNIMTFIAAFSIVIKQLNVINEGILTQTVIFAALYISIIKLCGSTMKRNLTKFKEN